MIIKLSIFIREFFGTSNPYGDLLNILEDPVVMRSIAGEHGKQYNNQCLRKVLQLSLSEVNNLLLFFV